MVINQDREIDKRRRGFNANADKPNKLLWPVLASCGSYLKLRSEEFINNSKHIHKPTHRRVCFFWLWACQLITQQAGYVCLSSLTIQTHANTQTFCICIIWRGCLWNTAHISSPNSIHGPSAVGWLTDRQVNIFLGDWVRRLAKEWSLVWKEEGKGDVVSGGERPVCQSDTPGGLYMIDMSVPAGLAWP